jgi:hypothetical protein
MQRAEIFSKKEKGRQSLQVDKTYKTRKKRKTSLLSSFPFKLNFYPKLLLGDCTNGALSSASCAVDTLVSVNLVLTVAHSNSVYGALSLACATSDTFV